jgi:hypothetical protein
MYRYILTDIQPKGVLVSDGAAVRLMGDVSLKLNIVRVVGWEVGAIYFFLKAIH